MLAAVEVVLDPESSHAPHPVLVNDRGKPVTSLADLSDPLDVAHLLEVWPELAHYGKRRSHLLVRDHLSDLGRHLLLLPEPHPDATRVVLEAFETGEEFHVRTQSGEGLGGVVDVVGAGYEVVSA
jgi:hypothetical protein